jgi:hypothetical protein
MNGAATSGGRRARRADAWRLYDATPITGPTLVATGGAGLPTRVRRRETWEMAAKGFER